MQTDVRLVEDIVRRIESAENSGRFGDSAGMLADDAVIRNSRRNIRVVNERTLQ